MVGSPFVLIIPAAGSGSRMGHNQNKLFITLAGQPVIWHTIKAFEHCAGLKEIILAIRSEDQVDIQMFLTRNVFAVPIRTIFGGETRQQSVFNALQAVDASSETVWIHDGARPFIKLELLERLTQLPDTVNTVVAVPAKDTVKKIDSGGFIVETPERSQLWLAQTPQVFHKRDLLDANHRAVAAGFQGTDDASLMEWAGYPVSVIQGDYFNIKITTPEDLVLAEAILGHIKRS